MEKILKEQKIPYKKVENKVVFHTKKATDALAVLAECKDTSLDFEAKKGTLNEVFLAITGKEIRQS